MNHVLLWIHAFQLKEEGESVYPKHQYKDFIHPHYNRLQDFLQYIAEYFIQY